MHQDPVLSHLYQSKDDLKARHAQELEQVDDLIQRRIKQLQCHNPSLQKPEERLDDNARKAKAISELSTVAKRTPGIMQAAIEMALQLIRELDRPVQTSEVLAAMQEKGFVFNHKRPTKNVSSYLKHCKDLENFLLNRKKNTHAWRLRSKVQNTQPLRLATTGGS
jgi:hypothetical protein